MASRRLKCSASSAVECNLVRCGPHRLADVHDAIRLLRSEQLPVRAQRQVGLFLEEVGREPAGLQDDVAPPQGEAGQPVRREPQAPTPSAAEQLAQPREVLQQARHAPRVAFVAPDLAACDHRRDRDDEGRVLDGGLHALQERVGRVSRAMIRAAHVPVARQVDAAVQRVAAGVRVALDDQQAGVGTAAIQGAHGRRPQRAPEENLARLQVVTLPHRRGHAARRRRDHDHFVLGVGRDPAGGPRRRSRPVRRRSAG